jgi:hypothetical protein
MLLGLFVWWLVDTSKRRALVALLTTMSLTIAVTWRWMGHAWLAYPSAVSSFAGAHRWSPGQIVQMSPWSLFDLALPGASALAMATGGIVAITGAWLAAGWIRSNPGNTVVSVSSSVFIMLWLSPHALIYDWVFVAWALVFVHRNHRATSQVELSGLALAAAVGVNVIGSGLLLPRFGFTAQIAVPVLAAVWIRMARLLAGDTQRVNIEIDLRTGRDRNRTGSRQPVLQSHPDGEAVTSDTR